MQSFVLVRNLTAQQCQAMARWLAQEGQAQFQQYLIDARLASLDELPEVTKVHPLVANLEDEVLDLEKVVQFFLVDYAQG